MLGNWLKTSILMAGIIFLAVLIDSLRARRVRQLKRRTIRPIDA